MGYCILHIGKIKNFGQMSAAYKHNYRISPVPNAIPEMKELNQELVPLSHNTYNETYKAFTANLGYGINKNYRKNGVLALDVMLSFSREDLSNIDLEKWKANCLVWLRNSFNACPEKYGDNLLSACLHMDESMVHIHALLCVVDNRGHLNASYYINGREKLRELQDSYAEAMRPLGLIKGMFSCSPLKHQDIQKMYGSLEKAFQDNDIPKWEEKDTPETYQEKVREFTKEKIAVFHKKLSDTQRELEKAKVLPSMDTTVLEKKLASANRKIYKLEAKQEEFEREFGGIEIVQKTMESVRLLKAGLEDMDTDKANEFIDLLNDIVRHQRKKEREESERAKKRKKNIFDIII